MEHKHEPLVQLDGLIKCRICGELLPYAEEEICKVSSAMRVRRVLEEIAVAGEYTADSYEKGFIVYSKKQNGIIEEVTGEKLSDRNYRVYKRLISKGGDA